MSSMPSSGGRTRTWLLVILGFAGIAGLTVLLLALLTNIFERKQEARQPFVRVVEVTEDTMDPQAWGRNWPSQYDSYLKTSLPTSTRYGGRGAGASDAGPAAQKLDRDPWLKRIFAGYAFSIDYRDRRGHVFALFDQEQTRRVTERKQPGACLHCHAANLALYRFVGKGDTTRGFVEASGMPYQQAHDMRDDTGQPLIKHSISCVDCHEPKTMALRVTRPGFIAGIKTLKATQGVADYDPNRDATRQEMRSFVCGQCHVEYHFKGPEKRLVYPWAKGLKIDDIFASYDESGHKDWTHAVTGAPVIKAQHPEFELWNQGIHARSGVACADCHMPYKREGALKISDHHVRSPMLNIQRACQTCHRWPEEELRGRVETIQERTFAMRSRALDALIDLIEDLKAARDAGAGDEDLAAARSWQRRAQFYVDFVEAENSMGFHAPQESMRILGESIDYSRRGQNALRDLRVPANPSSP